MTQFQATIAEVQKQLSDQSAQTGNNTGFFTQANDNEKPSGLVGKKVMIAEDEIFIAMDISMALQDAGAEVLGPFARYEEGLQSLTDMEPPDVAILDINLQDGEVYPLAEELIEAGVPVLFHTGHGDLETLTTKYPGARVCIKPVMIHDLLKQAEASSRNT